MASRKRMPVSRQQNDRGSRQLMLAKKPSTICLTFARSCLRHRLSNPNALHTQRLARAWQFHIDHREAHHGPVNAG
jgi:hypothetical protein